MIKYSERITVKNHRLSDHRKPEKKFSLMFLGSSTTNTESLQDRPKRGRHSSSSSNNSTSKSSESSPEVQLAKRPTMPVDNTTAEYFKRLEEGMKAGFAQVNSTIQVLSMAIQEQKGQQAEVPMLKAGLESVRKQALSKTLVISGIGDDEEEDFMRTEGKVQDLVKGLGLNEIDIDMARRMGRYKEGKHRLIELTVVRLKDKFTLL